MNRFALVAAGLLSLYSGTADARYPHYGSVGVQFGFYKYPPPGAFPVVGAGYAPSAAPIYSSAGYGYASPGYAPAPAMAPSGGCYGGGAGYSPAMAPSVGCYGGAGYGYAPGAGYGAPAAGMFPFAIPGALGAGGGFLETVRTIREVAKELNVGGSDSALKADVEKLRDEVKALRNDIGSISKDEISKLRDEVRNLRSDLTVLKVPAALDERLAELKKEQQKSNLEIQKIIKALGEAKSLPVVVK
jgi:hypothetical protein